ncbi:RidA family protein [Paraglaciecola aestuariivivens]
MQLSLVFLIGNLLLTLSLSSHALANSELERKYYSKWETEIGYAQVVQQGRNLYLSGVVAGGKDMPEQVHNVYAKISKILQDYNADTSHIVKEVVYTTDMPALKKASAVRKAFFKSNQYPAASWIQISRLYEPSVMVEVEVQVYLPEQ